MNPEHPLAKKKNLTIKDLNGKDFISFEKDIPTRKATDEILSNVGVEISIVMEFDNVETVKRALEINAGIAILPGNTVTNETERNQLTTCKLDHGTHVRPLAIIHKKNRMLTPALRSFVELMKNANPVL
jgi:DNA-binding transcriptional LysR family regulator